MALRDLKPLFADDTLLTTADPAQLDVFNQHFVADFITDPFTVGGRRIIIDTRTPRVREFNAYSETFFHLVTRKSPSQNHRFFECRRANRIHWIKPILLAHPTREIQFYRWRDEQGICKKHYWLYAKDFMVVTKDIAPNVQIVTAFCVDRDSQETYYERYVNFRDGRQTC